MNMAKSILIVINGTFGISTIWLLIKERRKRKKGIALSEIIYIIFLLVHISNILYLGEILH